MSLPDDGIITGRIGDAINYTFNVSGTAPVTVSLEGTLPAGLTFDENTLTISGTPTATTDSDGTVVTVRAVNACGSDVALITIVIVGQNQCIPPVFVTPELNTDITSRVNEPFSYEIQTQHTGGGSVEIFVSALPAGLTLNGTTIEGTPTQIGSFTITITIADENDIQCSASRDMAITITGGTTGCVTNCGGGQDPPKVVLFGDPSGQPLASASFVFLSQVPYTGLGLDIVQAVLFLLGLLVISGVGAYGVMRGGGTVTERIRRTLTRIKTAFVEAYTVPVATVAKHKQQKDSYEEAYHREQKSVAHNVVDAPVADTDIDTDYTEYLTMTAPKEKAVTPENLPTTEVSTSADVAPTPETNHIPVLVQTVAREEKVLLSKDAALMITGTARDTEHAQEIARQVIDIAKGKYPREDGWLVLDESRTRKVLFISAIQMTPLFIDWLVRGEDKKVFTFLRRLRGQKQPIADFMRAVVTELDNAHQARLEGTTDAVDMFTMDTLEAMGTQQLERLIGTLLRGVDERYDESYTSARLALVRALDMVRKNELIQSGDAYGTTHTMAQQSNRELA